MKILLLTQVLPYPLDSGPKVKTWSVLRCLAEAHEVTLVSFVRGDQSAAVRQLQRFCKAVYTVPIKRGALADVAAIARSLRHQQPWVIERDDQPAMRQLLAGLVAQTRFDVVHADQLNMAQYAVRVDGARKVLDAHNALWLLYRRLWEVTPSGVRRALLGRDWTLLRAYESRVCQTVDAVLAVSEEDRQALQELTPSPVKINVVPIAVDTHEVRPLARHAAPNHIVHIGTMYWPPNTDAVLWFVRHVYPRIRAARPDVMFDVIGTRPTRSVRTLADESAGIRVTGYVADPTPYLERAAAVIVPLRVGSGMRVKILTALAQGLPVVSTSLGCAGIAVESGRHLLIADQPDDFAAATLRLLDDPGLAAGLGRNGRQLVETRYDYRSLCSQLREVYRGATGHDDAYRRVG